MSNIITEQRKISINEMPSEIPDFNSSFQTKDSLIKQWIMDWILSMVSKNKIKENDILPNKNEISRHLGVSIGTVQNAIRYVEDEGYLKSKQKLGTMISNLTNPISSEIKSTSKRDKTIVAIKKYLIKNSISVGMPLPSTRKMSDILGVSQNTVRLAYEYLCSSGIIESRQLKGNEANWILKSVPSVSKEEIKISNNLNTYTLVDKITESLKNYLFSNFKPGDKIPTHEDIASKLGVSIKTVHDCIKTLSEQGIIITRRGRYGSILAVDPSNLSKKQSVEDLMFAPAGDAVFYSYQKIEEKIVDLINNKYNPGDKLPSMQELSKSFDVSTNTVRRALKNLALDGYITFDRGRYGGTFVVDKPDYSDSRQYQWLSINPDYI